MFIDFLERKGTEKHLCGREALIGCLPTRAPTGDWTPSLSEHGTVIQPTEPPGQGS